MNEQPSLFYTEEEMKREFWYGFLIGNAITLIFTGLLVFAFIKV